MKRSDTTMKLAALGATVLLGSSLYPAAAGAEAPSDEWDFNATLYAFYSSIGGTTAFPAGAGSELNISQDDLIDHLKFTGMAAFEAQKGRWGGFTDLIYLNVGESKNNTTTLAIGGGTPLPPGITADLSLDVKAWVWTLAGTYRVISSNEANLDFIAGARLLDIEGTLDYAFSTGFGPFVGPGQQGSGEAKLENWDGIVGIKGQLNFGASDDWFARYYLDVGTGESDLTWQGIAGVGYAFGWGEVVAAWRYLDYEFKSGEKMESLDFNGPALGVSFRW
jgi:hypothetical protein